MGTAASVAYQHQEEPPVFQAAKEGDIELLQTCTDEELASVDNEGHTPLFHVAKNNHIEACRFLITDRRVALDIDAFHEAIKGEHLAICKQFVDNNISLDGALRVALENHALPICKYLLFINAPIHEEGNLEEGKLTIRTMIANTERADIIEKFNDIVENSVMPFAAESPPSLAIRPVSRAGLANEEEIPEKNHTY